MGYTRKKKGKEKSFCLRYGEDDLEADIKQVERLNPYSRNQAIARAVKITARIIKRVDPNGNKDDWSIRREVEKYIETGVLE